MQKKYLNTSIRILDKTVIRYTRRLQKSLLDNTFVIRGKKWD